MGNIAVTVDLVVLTIRDRALHVLLVRRRYPPYRGRWALPGGFVLPDEDLFDAATRELAEETGIHTGHLEQLATYGAPRRDPRGRVVTVAYLALVPDLPSPAAGSDAAAADWVPITTTSGPHERSASSRAGIDGRSASSRAGIDGRSASARAGMDGRSASSRAGMDGRSASSRATLAFDHARILADGVERARAKLEYTPLGAAFCPPEFTVAQLRDVYEAVWGAPLDPRNFHRKVTATAGFVEPAGASTGGGRGRPAQLYRRGPAEVLYPPLLRPAAGTR